MWAFEGQDFSEIFEPESRFILTFFFDCSITIPSSSRSRSVHLAHRYLNNKTNLLQELASISTVSTDTNCCTQTDRVLNGIIEASQQ